MRVVNHNFAVSGFQNFGAMAMHCVREHGSD
jgi:hypothetical protein